MWPLKGLYLDSGLRAVAAFLTITLTLSSSALALRTEQTESQSGLEEIRLTLEGGSDRLLKLASTTLGLPSSSATPATAPPAAISPRSSAGLEEGAEATHRGFLRAVAVLGAAPVTRIVGMFVGGDPNRPVDDALGARVNLEGRKELYVVDLNAAAQIDPADLPVVDRILVHPGVVIPSAWRNAASVTVPKDLEAAEAFLAENARKGDIFLVAPDATGTMESWGNLFIRYGVLGIRTTDLVVEMINQLTDAELVVLLGSLGPQGGLILGAAIQSRTPGERNLLVSA